MPYSDPIKRREMSRVYQRRYRKRHYAHCREVSRIHQRQHYWRDPIACRLAHKEWFRSNPLYQLWRSMINRCHKSWHVDYHMYGARGITVCVRWRKDWKLFRDDMGPRPAGYTLDRINNNRGYSPSNCRWSSPKQQSRNRRTNVYVTAFGERKTVMDWSRDRRCRVGMSALYLRIKHGWPPKAAILMEANRAKSTAYTNARPHLRRAS